MTRLSLQRFPFLVSLFPVFFLTGCSQPSLHKQEAYVFGTLVEVSVYGENEAKAESAVGQVLANFDALHVALHAWQPGELNSINEAIAGATAAVPAQVEVTDRWAPTLLPILSEATALSERSEGLFNPAIGNLVRLWGFHADSFQPRLPDPAEIDRLNRDLHCRAGGGHGDGPVEIDRGVREARQVVEDRARALLGTTSKVVRFSSGRTTRQLARIIEVRMPDPCLPVSRTCSPPPALG